MSLRCFSMTDAHRQFVCSRPSFLLLFKKRRSRINFLQYAYYHYKNRSCNIGPWVAETGLTCGRLQSNCSNCSGWRRSVPLLSGISPPFDLHTPGNGTIWIRGARSSWRSSKETFQPSATTSSTTSLPSSKIPTAKVPNRRPLGILNKTMILLL